jgi:hypothetical protein
VTFKIILDVKFGRKREVIGGIIARAVNEEIKGIFILGSLVMFYHRSRPVPT